MNFLKSLNIFKIRDFFPIHEFSIGFAYFQKMDGLFPIYERSFEFLKFFKSANIFKIHIFFNWWTFFGFMDFFIILKLFQIHNLFWATKHFYIVQNVFLREVKSCPANQECRYNVIDREQSSLRKPVKSIQIPSFLHVTAPCYFERNISAARRPNPTTTSEALVVSVALKALQGRSYVPPPNPIGALSTEYSLFGTRRTPPIQKTNQLDHITECASILFF